MSRNRDTGLDDRSFFRLRKDNAVLLVIDMQNAFLEPGSMLEVSEGRKIIPAINRLVDQCRKTGLAVIWVQLDSSEPFGGLLLEKYPALRDNRVLFRGTHSFELYHELVTPDANDFRIIKHKYDAFYDTDLDSLLRNLAATSIIITGVTTNCCCESTARSAFERDYRVVVTSDGTAAFEKSLHEATLASIRELFGRVLSVDEVIAELED